MEFKMIKNATKIYKKFADATGKNSPAILTGVAVVATIVAVVTAVKATPKMNKVIEEKKAEGATTLETVKAVAPIMAPTAVATAVSVGCTLASNKISSERIAALTTMCSLGREAAKEYKEQTKKIAGEEKAAEIDKAVAQKRCDDIQKSRPVRKVIDTGYGTDLILDDWNGDEFRSCGNYIEKVINNANQQLNNGMSVSLNEIRADLGLPRVKGADDLGWNVDTGQIRFHFSSIVGPNNEPCLVFVYDTEPMLKYYKINR